PNGPNDIATFDVSNVTVPGVPMRLAPGSLFLPSFPIMMLLEPLHLLPAFYPSPDLTRPTASGVLGGLQHQDPIWIPVAVIARSREVLSAGIANGDKTKGCIASASSQLYRSLTTICGEDFLNSNSALIFWICDACSSRRAVTASIPCCCCAMIASCFATMVFSSCTVRCSLRNSLSNIMLTAS